MYEYLNSDQSGTHTIRTLPLVVYIIARYLIIYQSGFLRQNRILIYFQIPALEYSAIHLSNNLLFAGRDYDVSSEEQLISAFEIADTNGDGIVTYSEALDAISALITSPEDLSSDKEGSSGDISLGNLFSSQFTPSLTYAEFNLLLLNLQAQSSYSSALKIVKSSLDYVCRSASLFSLLGLFLM